MTRRFAALTTVAMTLLLAAGRGAAQPQAVLLQLRPRVGDTLTMRLDQSSRLSSQRTIGGHDSVQVLAATEMHVFSHAVVEQRSADETILLATTDSVLLTSSDEKARAANLQTAQRLKGQRTRLRIAPDGGVTIVDDGATPRGMAEAASLMPATFPKTAVSIEESWTREMRVPAGTTTLGTAIGGRVRATFRLDSMTRGGQLAHLSMRGELHPEDSHPRGAVLESGTLSGSLIVDRTRGWLAESDVTVVAQSIMLPLAGFAGTGMHLTMIVTQRMRLVEKR